MISFHTSGELPKADSFLKRLLHLDFTTKLERYAQKGVDALAESTPKDTGVTAASWYYEIQRSADSITITWSNSNVNQGENIALLIQYGHGTGTGGYVTPIDYVNPAMEPIFKEIEELIIKEVNAL